MRNMGWKTIGCNCCWSWSRQFAAVTITASERRSTENIFCWRLGRGKTADLFFKVKSEDDPGFIQALANGSWKEQMLRQSDSPVIWLGSGRLERSLIKCLHKTIKQLGIFFFPTLFCLRCVWRFFTFLVYWSNKQKNLWNCEAFPWLGTSTADRQAARAAKRALYDEENTHTHIHTQKVPT